MARSKTRKGFVVDQRLELGVWLGIAGLALGSAHILLWRQRRVFARSQQDARVQELGLVQSAVTESASSVIAS